MSWDYRVVHSVDAGEGYSEDVYAIHEVYYTKKKAVKMYSAKPIAVQGESLEDLRNDLIQQAMALDNPVLEQTDLDKIKVIR